MHEVSIAVSILDAVKKEAELHPPGRPVKVGVRIGEMAGVDRDALEFSFEAVVKDSGLEPLALDIQAGVADELVFSYLEMEDE
jgi:hydrogenase nickel incorporation protein HypA/HybF